MYEGEIELAWTRGRQENQVALSAQAKWKSKQGFDSGDGKKKM